MNNINPFNLLGVTINSSHKEVRRAYYKLSLICHPDKGGSKDDMIMLHNAYNYVMEQIEFSEKAEMFPNCVFIIGADTFMRVFDEKFYLNKKDMLKIAESGNYNDILKYSWSCWYPKQDGTPCGKCIMCRERILK